MKESLFPEARSVRLRTLLNPASIRWAHYCAFSPPKIARCLRSARAMCGAAAHCATGSPINTLLLNVLARATIAHESSKPRENLEIAHGLHAREIGNSLKLRTFSRD